MTLISMFAEDGDLLFESQEELQKGINVMFKTFKRLGLTCQNGRGSSKTMTVEMLFPPPRSSYEDANMFSIEQGWCGDFYAIDQTPWKHCDPLSRRLGLSGR
jgi:hypothetical protein